MTLVLLSTHSKPYVSYCLYPLERQKSRQVRQLINKKLYHDCAEISDYLSRYITNLRELKAIINKILESDYWNACHLDRNSIIILECLRYINSDIYRIIKDNSEPTFEEKKLPDALSKLDETNPVKQYLRDTNIIDTASERNQPIEFELNHRYLNSSLKYYGSSAFLMGIDSKIHKV